MSLVRGRTFVQGKSKVSNGMIYCRNITTLLRRHWQLFRKCWLNSEKLSFLLHGTILSNWVFVLKHIVCEANDRQRTLTRKRDLTHVLSTSCFQHCLKPCKTSLWGTGSTATNKKIKPFLALGLWVSTADAIHSSPFCTASGLSVTYSQGCACSHC